MTLKECYEELEGDYEGMLGRLGSEALVKRFALKFLADGSFQDLKQALEEGNYEAAFSAAHTLKGVSANLSFTKLCEAASELTEKLRGGSRPDGDCYFQAVEAAYDQTLRAIEGLQGA